MKLNQLPRTPVGLPRRAQPNETAGVRLVKSQQTRLFERGLLCVCVFQLRVIEYWSATFSNIHTHTQVDYNFHLGAAATRRQTAHNWVQTSRATAWL